MMHTPSNLPHTDGPWVAMPVHEWERQQTIGRYPSITHVGDWTVATAASDRYDDHASDKDDAKFIAAAPETAAERDRLAAENARLRTELNTLAVYADVCAALLKATHPGKAASLTARVRSSLAALEGKS